MASKSPKHASKVGIFMPYYNMKEFIGESLESLDAQTFKDFAVTIADDASPKEDAHETLDNITQDNYRVFYEKKNLGLIKIANKYMALLDAEYIMLFSPDDKMDPEFLSEQVQYLDTHPDVHAVCTNIQEFGEGDGVIEYNNQDCTLPQMLIENRFSGAALVRKDAWVNAGMHDTNPELYPNLDYDLWLSMLSKGYTLGTIQKPLFYWRVVKRSLSHNIDADRQLVFRRALFKKYKSLYKKHFDFVIEYYMTKLHSFENYYAVNEEGHAWLDAQYHSLTDANARLVQEKEQLEVKLRQSISRPYLKSIAKKVVRKIKK